MRKKRSKFDIRHKEALTLFLKEYFDLFFPDLAKKIRFESAIFLDKELIALFDESEKETNTEQHRITDALILVQIFLSKEPKWILIHWEQQGKKKENFEERMFHYFCGIYFKFRKLIFPIAMFTDPVRWKKPVRNKFGLSLLRYKINEFTYHIIKLKDYKAEEFEKQAEKNPLAAAYLPLTDYPKKDRPEIKAKAMRGIAKLPSGQQRATLFSLIQESMPLDNKEEEKFQKLVRENPIYQEVKMLQSVKEVGIEEGIEIGIQEGKQLGIQEGKQLGIQEGKTQALRKTAKSLLKLGKLTKKEITDITGLTLREINELEKSLKSE